MASGGQPRGPDHDWVSAYTLPAGGGQGEDEDECRKNWMKRETRYRKSHERSKDCPASKEMQENLMESMQHQLQEAEKRRNDLMPEHQKLQKRSKKVQSIQDKRKIYRKKAWRQEKKCEKSEKKLSGRKSASHGSRTKSTKTHCQLRKRKQNFRDCKLERNEEVAMHRKRWNAVWKRLWNIFSLWDWGKGCTR